MKVGQAKGLARRWVAEAGAALPGFAGAFYHGSSAWLADEAELPTGSDVDIMVVLEGPPPPVKLGKFLYGGALLEVSHISWGELASPEHVLGSSHLAGSLRAPGIIADPSGRLTALQAAVARGYARRGWVRARCEHVRQKILGNLRALEEPAPLHDHVSAWLFAAGLTTHALLVAGLRNPTVRRRYVAARELLAAHGRLDIYEELLALLGCAGMGARRVEHHLAGLAELFEAARATIRTPFFFASDISEQARPIAIDGSRELVEAGLHREAIFWIVATASRCQKVLHHDAPAALRERFLPAYLELLADLGVRSPADLRARGGQVRAYLPRLMEVAEAIMAATPEVTEQ